MLGAVTASVSPAYQSDFPHGLAPGDRKLTKSSFSGAWGTLKPVQTLSQDAPSAHREFRHALNLVFFTVCMHLRIMGPPDADLMHHSRHLPSSSCDNRGSPKRPAADGP